MPIIGINFVLADHFGVTAGALGMQNATRFYTAIAGDKAVSVNAYTDSWAATTLVVGIYTVTANKPDILVGGEHNISVPAGGPPKVWNSTVINVALTAGVTYTIAWRAIGSVRTQVTLLDLATGSNDGSSPLPGIWTHASNTRGTFSIYANVTNVAPPLSNIYYPCCAQLIT